MIKLLDPVVQSVGIIFFIYCLDANTHISYRMVLIALIGWQMLSVIVNFFFWKLKLLKAERILFSICMLVYLGVFYFFERNVKENFVPLDTGLKPSVPMNQVVLMTVGVVIAFWYNVICYREFRKMFGAINRGNNR
ncbi:MAG: hypothetical protein K0Q79_2239 [Flavipsychrobacter sp.]|jgi:hypothetical protein|nr:hypothetical protein [Flavipsychrobacter sp.]